MNSSDEFKRIIRKHTPGKAKPIGDVLPELEKSEDTELEWKLQVATADYLTGNVYKGLKIIARVERPFPTLKFHHPALEYRQGGSAEAAKYARRGTTPGLLDWLLWGPNRWHGMIEMKVAHRKLNDNQKKVWHWAKEYGFPLALCETVHEFRDAIIGFGFECKNMACREPDYRTESQKYIDSFEMFVP